MDFTSLLIQLVAGAIGGNAAGAALKKYSLGTLGNTIAGILGGGIGGQLIGTVAGTVIEGFVGDIAGGARGRRDPDDPSGRHQGHDVQIGRPAFSAANTISTPAQNAGSERYRPISARRGQFSTLRVAKISAALGC
jgi:hypothetical protein